MTVAAAPEGAAAARAAAPEGGARPLRIAIFNQVDFHLHVVAGAMAVLAPLSTALVDVWLSASVVQRNRFGFMDWLGGEPGFRFRQIDNYDGETYDLLWLISPEWDVPRCAAAADAMAPAPALRLVYVHNADLPEPQLRALAALSCGSPLLGMAPHVAAHLAGRLAAAQWPPADAGGAPLARQAEWALPIWPFRPPGGAQQGDVQLRGFSITGSLDPSLRDYDAVWAQLERYRDLEGSEALEKFRLNILGDVGTVLGGDFSVPDSLREYVALYKTPPDAEFYDVIYNSLALVPALANPAYYKCKLTSAVISSLMTGVPLLADARFLAAYSLFSPETVFQQADGESELAAMFRVAREPPGRVWAVRGAVEALRCEVNERAGQLLRGWLREAGLAPDAAAATSSPGLL